MFPLPFDLLHWLWAALLGYAFYYPLFMAYLWMAGALHYYFHYERKEPPLDALPELDYPPISILIPCFNEEDSVEETLRYALAVDYPEFEVIAIDDGSSDATAGLLDEATRREPRLRVVHLAQNQGKAIALNTGCLLARHEHLVCIDGDALLEPNAPKWLVRQLIGSPRVGAVTGNPRIRNRSTLFGKVQVGEFSSIIGIIKRAQRTYGRLFTISGVIAAFRKTAVRQAGYWSDDVLTEDIDMSWKLQLAHWDVRFEPHAQAWILMPETFRGLWKQRLRWAKGGLQVLLRNAGALCSWQKRRMWPIYAEYLFSLVWAYVMILLVVVWLAGMLFPQIGWMQISSPLVPGWHGMVLGMTCLLQFTLSKCLDRRHDHGIGRNFFWMIWYPLVFWTIHIVTTVVALPQAVAHGRGLRARWTSPDRGVRA
ncbi:poly-beta-1,6-N-acetyl-D-glucosamine synthase [Crenobacter cavernae]|uniref:Poly-beta-1,6-N-acetyl-D-glucosamine synthase n=1 Tax=Crenobacter cavernae TaxID=2290923 RepID=A0A345Y3X8_9NEIS|nr:poly-beta-1,6-N-acetyl-D-glucosamine synthase [Crenobacter cavernae]AXK38630.1 poly-beta-1,6 N-acetyl-D-glucosamine synthase [Crenobacter cavernae]